MNEKQGGILGSFIGVFTEVFTWIGETIDWGNLVNAAMNAIVGTIIAVVVTYLARKALGLHNHTPRPIINKDVLKSVIKEISDEKDKRKKEEREMKAVAEILGEALTKGL